MTQVMNMLVFLNRKSYYDLMLILNGIMVALVRLIFIHIFMIFIGLANFGSPFKTGSGPNVQLMIYKHSRSTMYCNDYNFDILQPVGNSNGGGLCRKEDTQHLYISRYGNDSATHPSTSRRLR